MASDMVEDNRGRLYFEAAGFGALGYLGRRPRPMIKLEFGVFLSEEVWYAIAAERTFLASSFRSFTQWPYFLH
jgi:hypothetical protein